MTYAYELVPFSDEVRDAYLSLLPHQEDLVQRGKIEWKLGRSPAGQGLASLAREGRRVVGLNAFMPVTMRLYDTVVTGYQSMDTIVSPEARGKGVFPKLIETFQEHASGALFYGFPNAASAPGFFNKLGWIKLSAAPYLFRPLRAGYFLKRFRWLPDIAVPYPHQVRGAQPFGRANLDAMERAWLRFSEGMGCAAERTSAYIDWRIFSHPTESYSVLGADDGSYVVGSISRKHGGSIGYILEAIGSENSLSHLISAMVQQHRRDGADVALAWCPRWAPNYAAYRKAGLYVLPEKLRPIEINFGARTLKGTEMKLPNKEEWYISYLDSDTV